MQTNQLTIRKDLSEQEKRELIALLAERQARGLKVPQVDSKNFAYSDQWHVDENGFFRRNSAGKPYDPAGEQLEFISSNSIYVSLQGGRGSGKTAAGAQKALRKIREGRTGIVVNPDLENFKTSTWPELRDWIPWNMVIPKHRVRRSPSWDVTRPFSIVFINGAVLYCRGLRDPESGRGHNVNWLWYDEARRDKTGLAWKNACAGVRLGTGTQRWITTTPAGLDSWIAAFFDRKEVPPEVFEILKEVPDLGDRELIESFHVSMEENKKNLDPIFYATQISNFPDGYLRRREVDGIAANEEGALGDRYWFLANPVTGKSHVVSKPMEWRGRYRYWDLAATEKKVGNDPDETVGSLISFDDKKENFCLEDQAGGHWAWDKIVEQITNTAKIDGIHIPIYLEQEPASGGINQISALKNILSPLGFTVRAHDVKKDGDRVIAAQISWFKEAKQGHWFIVKSNWNNAFFSELDSFPDKDAHDDRVTSVTGGRLSIAPIKRWSSLKFAHIGQKIIGQKEGEVKIGRWGGSTSKNVEG
jgi:predicted phage terminase large subunit-like protein